MADLKPIRVGLVGAGGNMKLRHIPGFQAIDGVSIDVVCNRSIASSQAVADEYGIPRVAEDWNAVVNDESIDAICIGTWPYLHAPITIAALKAGKHVLTEARMAMNAAEAEAMLQASRAAPELVAQIVPSPFTLKWDATIANVLSSGALGELRELSVLKTLPMNADPLAPMNWRQKIEYSGNNTLMLGIYYEVAQRWLKREPVKVWSYGRIFMEERNDPETGSKTRVEIPETTTWMAEYADGLQLTGLMSGMEMGSGRDEFVICGTKGSLRLDLRVGQLYQTIEGSAEAAIEPEPEDIADWNVEADFVDSVREGTPVTLTSFEDGVNYMKFTDAARASFNAGGQWISIDGS